jgi:hypothetical protein
MMTAVFLEAGRPTMVILETVMGESPRASAMERVMNLGVLVGP